MYPALYKKAKEGQTNIRVSLYAKLNFFSFFTKRKLTDYC